MCLYVYAVPSLKSWVTAEQLSTASELSVERRNEPVEGTFYFSRGGGCSCSLLSGDADWAAPTWDLDPNILIGLSAGLELLAQEAGDFTFNALWVGDTPETETEIALSSLLEDVRKNRVKNKHTYFVRTT